MYRKAILLGLQFLLFNLEVGASSYEVVWEKEFDKPISKVVWAYENDTLYPKVLVIGKSEVLGKTEVRFLNPSGEVEARLTFRPSKVYISPNGKYVGVETFIPREDEPMWPKESYFRLYNDKGELLWQMERALGGPDEEYYVLISNKGVTAVLRPEYGGIDFYDIHGNCKTIIPFEDALGWGLRDYEGVWNLSGTRLIVGVTKHRIRSKSPEPWLILYDEYGNELWRRPVEGRYIRKIAVSPSGHYIIASIGGGKVGEKVYPDWVYVVNHKNNVINKIQAPSRRFTRVVFSPDESRFAMFIPGNRLYMVESMTGEILWTMKINLGSLSNTMAFTPNGKLMVAKFVENENGTGSKIIVYKIESEGKTTKLIEYDTPHLTIGYLEYADAPHFTRFCLFSDYLGIHAGKGRKKVIILKITK